ncbi:MAG TPA: DUF1772 domain-containing protein [Bryocella sp.]|nr:DUF1772 domain-containing protein [Bryocella sp.]
MVFLNILTTACIGLLIGTEFAVSVFINPILERLDTGTRVKLISYFAKRLGAAMPFWYALSALLLLAQAAIHRHDSSESLLIAAGVLWLAVIVLTLIFLVPINNRMIRLQPGSSAQASLAEHSRWELLHRGRVATLTAAMVCFLIAVLR